MTVKLILVDKGHFVMDCIVMGSESVSGEEVLDFMESVYDVIFTAIPSSFLLGKKERTIEKLEYKRCFSKFGVKKVNTSEKLNLSKLYSI